MSGWSDGDVVVRLAAGDRGRATVVPSANVSLIDVGVGDDVEAGQDVARVVDDHAAARGRSRAVPSALA